MRLRLGIVSETAEENIVRPQFPKLQRFVSISCTARSDNPKTAAAPEMFREFGFILNMQPVRAGNRRDSALTRDNDRDIRGPRHGNDRFAAFLKLDLAEISRP